MSMMLPYFLIFPLLLFLPLHAQEVVDDFSALPNSKKPPDLYDLSKPVNYAKKVTPYSRLERFLMTDYNKRIIPRNRPGTPVQVQLSMQLYQVVAVNEPQQYLILNAWLIERWTDEILYWDSNEFDGINKIVLPSDSIWMPDTTLYNSLLMNDEDTNRKDTVKIQALDDEEVAYVELMYPTMFKFSCLLDLRFFPFDMQVCNLTFGSWIYDIEGIDYVAYNKSGINPFAFHNCIENEGWKILGTKVTRRQRKFQCCPNEYALLDFTLYLQRKPLFYLVNLIAPTAIITLIAIIGFFSTSNMHEPREEKVTLGITTLLSMSILIFLVSDKLPSTSSFIPLIGWFYLSMMLLISLGTLASSFVIYIQKMGILGERPSKRTMNLCMKVGTLFNLKMPLLMKQAYLKKAANSQVNALRAIMGAVLMKPEGVVSPKTGENQANGQARRMSYKPIIPDGRSPTNPSEWMSDFTWKPSVKEAKEKEEDPVTGASKLPGSQRTLAEIEYDWIAAVIERAFLMIFMICFFFTCFGINGLGFYYWNTPKVQL